MGTDYGSYEWPPSGGGSGVATYATFADFPPTASPGTLAIALDTGDLYEYISGTWTLIASPGGALSLGNLDAQSGNAKGAALVSGVLSMQSASGTEPGLVNATTQTFAGQKTFSTGLTGTLTGGASLDLPLAGGTMSGAINMGSSQINALAMASTPAGTDAANVSYVQTAIAALNPQDACLCATIGSNIPGTYVSVAAGIGDTFAITSTATFTLDGITPGVGARVLFKDQTNGYQNGIYSLTTLANVGVLGAIFTRATDYDTPSDMNSAGLIPVISGTVNALSSWLQVATIVSIGPSGTALVFDEYTANPSLYLLKANNLSDVATKATAFNNISPLTTVGDTLYGAASGAGTRLAGPTSSTKQFLTSTGTGSAAQAPAWGTISTGDVPTLNQNTSGTAAGLSATLAIASGGTGQTSASTAFNALSPLTTGGDLLYGGASGAGTRLANGSAGQFLKSQGTTLAPVWANPTISLTAPSITVLTSTGSTTGYLFTISTNTTCAAGDTYTNNGNTYTVLAALSSASGPVFFASGASAPQASGTLTRATGSGTSSITFSLAQTLATYTVPTSPSPLYLEIEMAGGGGGGGASGSSGGTSGGAGTYSMFGALFLSAGGGTGGVTGANPTGGTGGAATINAGATGISINGAIGTGGVEINSGNNNIMGGAGGSTAFGGAGGGGYYNAGVGSAAVANSGSGGGGGGAASTGSALFGGAGGGAGGYINAYITSSISATYVYCVGTGGGAGSAGANGAAGGAGATGVLIVKAYYQ